MANAGIDYGRGMANADKDTGIRYGVIHAREVGAWEDQSEAVYGDMECGKCGTTITIDDSECPECGAELDSAYDMAEPLNFVYEGDGYAAQQGYDEADVFILRSPFYTYAQFCSPCAPGAGYLLNPFWGTHEEAEAEGFPKVYCFGHDWFEEEWTGQWVDCQYCGGSGFRDKDSLYDYVGDEQWIKNGGKVLDDKKIYCRACEMNFNLGMQGKVHEMIPKAPYPIYRVGDNERVMP